MSFFANLLAAIHSSRQIEAERVIRRYSYLAYQAREHDRKQKLEKARKAASAAASSPSCLGELPLCNQ